MAFLRAAGEHNLHISAVTLGELQAGIEITRQQDPERAAAIDWVDGVKTNWKVLPMDGVIFRRWAKLMHRRSSALTYDAMIAATALVHEFQIVTRNVKDFRPFGVATLDPYTYK